MRQEMAFRAASQRTKQALNDLEPSARPSEFCQAPTDFVHRKLVRNQTFMARYVPKMYLFCNFSAQDEPDIVPLCQLFVGTKAMAAPVEMTTRLRTLGRAPAGAEAGHSGADNATGGLFRARKGNLGDVPLGTFAPRNDSTKKAPVHRDDLRLLDDFGLLNGAVSFRLAR